MRKEFGMYLREKRIDKGHTIQELADKCELSYVTMSNIELGKTRPSISTLKTIGEALGMEYFELRQKLKENDEEKQ